jgi:hypothetical protein
MLSGHTLAPDQWLSTVVRPRPGKFFLYKTRAQYWAAVRRLSNTALDYVTGKVVPVLNELSAMP